MSKLNKLTNRIVDYLGIEKIPVEFSNTITDDSRLVLKPKIKILVNSKYIDNYIECAKAIVHEYRHWFQLNWVYIMDDELANRWKIAFSKASSLENADLLNNQNDSINYIMQDIEIDAFAFTKHYLRKYEGIDVIHPNKQYEDLIKKYIEINNRIM